MSRKILLLSITFLGIPGCAQTQNKERPYCVDATFDRKVHSMISFSVPLIDVKELKNIQNEVHIFDTRKQEEYNVSHIKNALYLGYEEFNPEKLKNIPKTAKIVLYCSIGYRSEKIGEKLISLGYSNVFNLYGSIFEWVNQGNEVFDSDDTPTKKVHTYNHQWSKWLDGSKAEKVW